MRAFLARAATGLAVIAAAIACGGTAVDQTRSGHPNESGGPAGTAGSTGSRSSSPGGMGAGGLLGCVADSDHECPLATGGFPGSGGSGAAVGGTGGAPYFNATIEFSVAGAGSYCRRGCVPPAVSISELGGPTLEKGNWCQTDCSTCSGTVCPSVPCLPDAPITTITRRWDGAYYTPSMCGSGTSCAVRNMASTGTYVATVCITPGTMTVASDGSPECVVTGSEVCGSIDFEFPSNGVFRGDVGM